MWVHRSGKTLAGNSHLTVWTLDWGYGSQGGLTQSRGECVVVGIRMVETLVSIFQRPAGQGLGLRLLRRLQLLAVVTEGGFSNAEELLLLASMSHLSSSSCSKAGSLLRSPSKRS